MSQSLRTNADLRALQNALNWLGNQPKADKVKFQQYNSFQLRVHRANHAYRPLLEALRDTEKQIVERYTALAGDDLKYLPNGSLDFGPHDSDFMKEHQDLLSEEIAEEPTVRAFTLEDFDHAGIAVTAAVMGSLGPLFSSPEERAAGDDEDGD